MDDPITKYAILTQHTDLRLHTSQEVPCEFSSERQKLPAAAGTLIKLFQNPGGKFSTVQVLNFIRHDHIYENLYDCPIAHLRKISEDLWPYVISIVEPERRLSLLQNMDQCRWVTYLKLNDLVSVSGKLFGLNAHRYDCIIRYIGPVEELRPVGYFFGLELLHLNSGHSPQIEEIPFAIDYMQCDPSLSIFTTADWISQLPNEVKKKFSAFDLLSGTLDKVRTAIGPNSSVSGVSNTNSLRRGKQMKKKEATAQFYDTPVTLQINSSNFKEAEMERRMQLLSNKPSMDTNCNQIIAIENEEFTQSVENYEKSLERQHGNNASIQHSHTTNLHQPPAGILKNRRITSCKDSKDCTNGPSKTLPLISSQDRDIIVIDKADILESTKHESNVIVVDKLRQQDIDLADLLGGNWPNTAGDAASLLNKTPSKQEEPQFEAGSGGSSNSSVSNGTQTKIDRNKSSNLLTQFSTQHPMETASFAVRNTNASSDASQTNNTFTAEGHRMIATPDLDFVQSSPYQEIPGTKLGVGSMVEVSIPDYSEDLYGVIHWIGVPPGEKGVMVGVELEDEHVGDKRLFTTDGSYNEVMIFKCHEKRALFVTPDQCSNDRRFLEIDGAVGGKTNANSQSDSKMFGQVECPSVPGAVAPIKIFNLEELDEICGKFKGIQGHHNSCYLDATLFSMFTFTSVFDSLLFRPPESKDISNYSAVQKVLREEIVNPLRRNVFVRADRVMKLRQLLDRLSSVSGLTSEEKDPEEFLNSLLAQIMRVEPFLKLSSGQDAYFYQLFVEKDDRLSFPTVQQLFEQSFYSSDIKLKEVPSCLIIQMPRFGKSYKMYPRILPSQVLDVTDIIEDSPRQCSVCGKLAEYECHDCYGILQSGVGLESTAFCRKCLEKVHMHAKRANHSSKKLSVPQDFRIMAEHMTVPRLYMELFAVVCIETSHYVAFVKAGSGPDAPWCFFDSMADRKGEQNGYNIPEMISVPDMPLWLSEDGARSVNETSSNDKMLPEHAKRLFCDAYMCMYQSTDVMMYR